jgi:shikimate dehydrogenase
MRLALLGYPINHSRSPELYQEFLDKHLTHYHLLSYETEEEIPSLTELAKNYDGLNITSPYKKHFVKDVTIESDLVQKIGAINTISLNAKGYFGTNTDVVAVEEILLKYQKKFGNLHLIILGGGVMAKVTTLVALKLNISINNLTRSVHGDLSNLDLTVLRKNTAQNIVVNACSREFIFKGIISREDIFWDFNYHFIPHQNTLPFMTKLYEDGLELLRLQAQAAITFWQQTNPKLKY